MLHKGTRWVYLPPGWFGDFDNCLWDIAGKAAGLPVHAIIGKVRNRISTQWLMHGATDRLRGNARNGTTQVLKMAHFAELYDTNIELNGYGGLFGHVHAHLGCCIDNTDFYECSGRFLGKEGHRSAGAGWGLTNAPLIEEGHIAPNELPGWGAEWDEEQFQSRVVAVH